MAVIQSSAIPTKRMEFSARKTCIRKRLKIQRATGLRRNSVG
jgi:hypothetical protein